MHGFALATLRRSSGGAIAEWLNWGSAKVVADRLLQIRHRFGNRPLTLAADEPPASLESRFLAQKLGVELPPDGHVRRVVSRAFVTRPVIVLGLGLNRRVQRVIPRSAAEGQQRLGQNLPISHQGTHVHVMDEAREPSVPIRHQLRIGRMIAAQFGEVVGVLEPGAGEEFLEYGERDG